MGMKRIVFTIPGEPCGKGRPKFDTRGPHVRAVTPKKTANYETLVKLEFQYQLCKMIEESPTGGVYVLIDAFFPIPQSKPKKQQQLMREGVIRPTKKPDWDNIGKIICDSLNQLAYSDDSHVVDGRVRKFYSDNPRTEVYLSTEEISANSVDARRNAIQNQSKKENENE